MKLHLYIIALLFLLGACTVPTGTYRMNEGIVYGPAGKMKVKSDSTFMFSWRSGLLKGETTGTWSMQGDTVIFNSEFQPDSLNKMTGYRYLTNDKWLYEEGKLYDLKIENNKLVKGSCYK